MKFTCETLCRSYPFWLRRPPRQPGRDTGYYSGGSTQYRFLGEQSSQYWFLSEQALIGRAEVKGCKWGCPGFARTAVNVIVGCRAPLGFFVGELLTAAGFASGSVPGNRCIVVPAHRRQRE